MMIVEIIQNTLMITSFVMIMMMLIEFLNIRSRGIWSDKLRNSKATQILFASIMGLIPGCLGVYTVVSLYTHNILGFGALVAAMISTSGDEAFIMFSMIPETAIKIHIAIFVIALAAGFLVQLFFNKKDKNINKQTLHFTIHEHEIEQNHYTFQGVINQLKNISFHRAVMLFGISLFVFGLSTGILKGHDHGSEPHLENNVEISHNHDSHDLLHNHDHDHDNIHNPTDNANSNHEHSDWNWVRISFLILSILALIILTIVPDHFLEVHLWGHIIKKHFFKIFLWTLGALIVIKFGLQYFNLEHWLNDNMIFVLLIAVLIGLIPESGPHLIFVTLFFEGTIPFSILLASSIVQDGHGALPLFAESKKSFFYVKGINLLVGFLAGYLSLMAGF